ncbi:unnamed protein product [Urochloa humidicola]
MGAREQEASIPRPCRPHPRQIRQNRAGARAGIARAAAWLCGVVWRSRGGEVAWRACAAARHARATVMHGCTDDPTDLAIGDMRERYMHMKIKELHFHGCNFFFVTECKCFMCKSNQNRFFMSLKKYAMYIDIMLGHE